MQEAGERDHVVHLDRRWHRVGKLTMRQLSTWKTHPSGYQKLSQPLLLVIDHFGGEFHTTPA